MGCGKTTVGKGLANETGHPFMDVDDEIVSRHGVISEIFATQGEEAFRKIETEVLREISQNSEGAIISTGGGCVMRPENVEIMKEHGRIVFLDTPFGHCLTRILGDKSRPMAKGGKEEISALYNKRIGTYSSCANITVRPEKTAARTVARLAKMLFPEQFEKQSAKIAADAEKYKYFVSVPSAMLYSEPAIEAECVDEALYGTLICITDETDGDYTESMVLCETYYGYKGYIRRKHIQPVTGGIHKVTKTVFSPWCDLLPTPEYKHSPIAVLPRGSVVEYIHDAGERFCRVFYGKKRYFVRKENLVPQYEDNMETGEKIAANALLYVGTPYRWGGKSPSGIDCSGLAFMAHSLCGVPLFRDAVFKEEFVTEITHDELRPGDLVYFKGHVAIFIGDGKIVHASASLGRVAVAPLCEIGLEVLHFARAKYDI